MFSIYDISELTHLAGVRSSILDCHPPEGNQRNGLLVERKPNHNHGHACEAEGELVLTADWTRSTLTSLGMMFVTKILGFKGKISSK